MNGDVVMNGVSVMNNRSAVSVMTNNCESIVFLLLVGLLSCVLLVCMDGACMMDNRLVVHGNNVVNGRNDWHFNSDLMMHNWLNNVVSGLMNDIVLGRMALLNDGSVMIDGLLFFVVNDSLM